jgi:hypothetical protein
MKRVAFVGLSGPTGYDYKNYQDKKSTIPNPILEAPLGLMVLYDKILFLHPSLCPKSMLRLPFVEFLSEKKDLSEYFIKISEDEIMTRSNPEYNYESVSTEYTHISQNIKQLLPNSICDNHSRKWEGLPYSPNATNPINVIYDNIIAKNESAAFTTNSVWHKTLFIESRNVLKENVVNYAIVHRIPNYIDSNGPFVKLIEEIRDRAFIREFRKKIDNLIKNNDSKSILDLTQQLEIEFEIIRDILHARIFEKSRFFESIASGVSLIPDLAGIPYIGSVVSIGSLINNMFKIHGDRKFGWTGFLLDLKNIQFSKTINSKIISCSTCGLINRPYSKFCNNCGFPLMNKG